MRVHYVYSMPGGLHVALPPRISTACALIRCSLHCYCIYLHGVALTHSHRCLSACLAYNKSRQWRLPPVRDDDWTFRTLPQILPQPTIAPGYSHHHPIINGIWCNRRRNTTLNSDIAEIANLARSTLRPNVICQEENKKNNNKPEQQQTRKQKTQLPVSGHCWSRFRPWCFINKTTNAIYMTYRYCYILLSIFNLFCFSLFIYYYYFSLFNRLFPLQLRQLSNCIIGNWIWSSTAVHIVYHMPASKLQSVTTDVRLPACLYCQQQI